MNWQPGDYALASDTRISGKFMDCDKVQVVHPPRAGLTHLPGYWVRQIDPPYATFYATRLTRLPAEELAKLELDGLGAL